jgi:hypothetical protein
MTGAINAPATATGLHHAREFSFDSFSVFQGIIPEGWRKEG